MFILLSGEPPFYHEDNFELFELIKKCEYDLSKPVWQGVSKEAKDLIKRILVADPAKRISATEIQSHPWITGTAVVEKPLNVLEAMRNWDTKRKIEA